MALVLTFAVVFLLGAAAGYGIRELISRRRRQLARSTFIYPE
jgi:hypothetical protein